MKNILKNILFLLLLCLCLIKRPDLINGIIYGIDLWKTCLFPSIFPLLILSDFALSTNIIKLISESIGKFFKIIFNIPKESAYVLFMAFFTGCPSNAKYIKDLLDNQIIDNISAIKILSMAQLYNPNLIITITTFLTFKNKLFLIGPEGGFGNEERELFGQKSKKILSFSTKNILKSETAVLAAATFCILQ